MMSRSSTAAGIKTGLWAAIDLAKVPYSKYLLSTHITRYPDGRVAAVGASTWTTVDDTASWAVSKASRATAQTHAFIDYMCRPATKKQLITCWFVWIRRSPSKQPSHSAELLLAVVGRGRPRRPGLSRRRERNCRLHALRGRMPYGRHRGMVFRRSLRQADSDNHLGAAAGRGRCCRVTHRVRTEPSSRS